MRKKKMAAVILTVGALLIAAGISLCAGFADESGEMETDQKTVQLFSDVKQTDWFYSDVGYVHAQGLMRGTGGALFEPQTEASRGMVVTILWRLDGALAARGSNFSDVKNDAYYYDAVAWALQCGITEGTGDQMFCPDAPITREQLAAVLYRYAGYKKYALSGTLDLSAYTDKDQISEYAAVAMQWANTNGIITGITKETLVPQGNAVRCQIAAMLTRFCTTVVSSNAGPEASKAGTAEQPSSGIHNVGGTGTGSGGWSKTERNDTDNAPLIAVDSVSAKAGDEVWLNAVLTNNPGILGMTLAVEFDDTVCTLQSVENGEAFRGILEFTPSNALGRGCKFLWDGMELSTDDIKNGAVMRMKFQVDDDAPPGNYPVTLKFSNGDIVDNNLISISPRLEAGYITIEQ